MSGIGILFLIIGIVSVVTSLFILINGADCSGASTALFILGILLVIGTLVIDLAPSCDEEMYVDYATIQSLDENTGAIERYITDNYDLGYRNETYNDYIEKLNAWRAEMIVRISMGDKDLAKLDISKLEPLPTLSPTSP